VDQPAVDLVALLAALAPRSVSVVRDGDAYVVVADPVEVVAARGEDAFARLDEVARDGFWTGFLAYDLGRAVERIDERHADDLGTPDLLLARHEARIVLTPGAGARVVGTGAARRVLSDALARAIEGGPVPARLVPASAAWESSLSVDEHAARVEAVKRLLRDGECYQVNLTRRLSLDERLDPVALFAAVHAYHRATHEALLTFGTTTTGPAVVSASPELFLRVRGRDVETRPIKGTGRDPERLQASVKDRAENVMIVDLARNDLGRVCVPGSVRAPAVCAVERHPGLFHLVSTVQGRLRADVTLGSLVRATFPPASVTGAPKPRVLQAIEDLEPLRRGVYCGAVGWVDAERAASEWSVAIRTFQMTDDRTVFGAGGGIVADSDAAREWDETELKAQRLLELVTTDAPAWSAS
jgi:anthranilate/para-aminobenzoate synthase component I